MKSHFDVATITTIINPPATYWVCCYMDGRGALHPNPLTADLTTKGCADRVRRASGVRHYQLESQGFLIMPFRLVFEPARVEVNEDEVT